MNLIQVLKVLFERLPGTTRKLPSKSHKTQVPTKNVPNKPKKIEETNIKEKPTTQQLTDKGFLICPIKMLDGDGQPLNYRTVKISSVLDHSGTAIDPDSTNHWGKRAKDQRVKTFNGELGDGEPSAEMPYGYTKKTPSPFFSSRDINYVGSPGTGDAYGPRYYLNYDGHAGYDFPYPRSTPVIAPADGKLLKVSPGGDLTYGANWNVDHSFYIQHDNGYTTWFRHCEKLGKDVEAQIGDDFSRECYVKKGAVIAYVGNIGTGPIHLHFEVLDSKKSIVDPYEEKLWESL